MKRMKHESFDSTMLEDEKDASSKFIKTVKRKKRDSTPDGFKSESDSVVTDQKKNSLTLKNKAKKHKKKKFQQCKSTNDTHINKEYAGNKSVEEQAESEDDSIETDPKKNSLTLKNKAKKHKKKKFQKSKSNNDTQINEEYAGNKSAEEQAESEDDDADDSLYTLNSSDDSDNEEQSSDPYVKHCAYVLPEECTEENLIISNPKLRSQLAYDDALLEVPGMGFMCYYKMIKSIPTPSFDIKNLDEFHLKKNLLVSVKENFEKIKETNPEAEFEVELSFLNMLTNYIDVTYYRQDYEKRAKLRRAYSIHVLNHILKSKAKIVHHNSKLKKNPEAEYRDQGFTQPTVLILAPFKGDCHLIINQIISLLPEKCKVMNKARFEEEYGSSVTQRKNRPADFYQIFEGVQDEDFKIGLRVQNEHINLFSDFYKSDLIVASPLGLKRIISDMNNKKGEADFLSSIEVLIVDRIDVMFIQNKILLNHALANLNHMVKGNNKKHKINYFRVREYYLDKKAKYYRQTIFLSSAENRFFDRHQYVNHCFNYKGYLTSFDPGLPPMINLVLPAMRVSIRFFDNEDPGKELLDRRSFFKETIIPEFLNDKSTVQTLIYVPCTFDFVHLRLFFRQAGISCFMLSEETDQGKVAEGRNLFYKGARHFMLYTERAHFYYRRAIKGIQHIIFYDFPTFPSFFHEICESLMDSHPKRKWEGTSCTILANKSNRDELKYIVGVKEADRMLKCKKQKTFFVDKRYGRRH